MKQTPLYERHVALHAKIIDFGGWAMPVQYSNVIDEHRTTRICAALFDICHMGEIEVKGPQALDLLQAALTRNLTDQRIGQVKLSALLNDQGGVIDDLTVYKFQDDLYWLVTNATPRERDVLRVTALLRNLKFDCRVEDISDRIGKLDLQGPQSEKILQPLAGTDLSAIPYYHFRESTVAEIPAIVSRSGYTGEDGFEIYAAADHIASIWDRLLDMGAPIGLKPAGLGARDTLRLEAGMMLNGQDITEEVCPLEVPYAWLVDWNKDFAGKAPLLACREKGIRRRLIGFEIIGRGIARNGYKVYAGEKEIGRVTSGSFSPTLNKAIGLAFVDVEYAQPATRLTIAIRELRAQAVVVNLPFYKRKKKTLTAKEDV